jgi:hypothetical protein
MFHPEANVKVYDRDIWWSDKWDPLDYGVDYDFKNHFFNNLKNYYLEYHLLILAIQTA